MFHRGRRNLHSLFSSGSYVFEKDDFDIFFLLFFRLGGIGLRRISRWILLLKGRVGKMIFQKCLRVGFYHCLWSLINVCDFFLVSGLQLLVGGILYDPCRT